MVRDPFQSVIARARAAVLAALATPDVEGYLCAVILRRVALSWAAEAATRLLDAPRPGLARSSDIAAAGLRLALGERPVGMEALPAVLRRELARRPLPPATRAHDDERLMLGIAAAVSSVPELLPTMYTEFSVVQDRSLRWDAVLFWSQQLAAGEWDPETAERAAELVASCEAGALAFDDAVAILALAADLFDSRQWKPDDNMLAAVYRAVERARRVVIIEVPLLIQPFDAALVLRGLVASPAHHLVRRSAVDTVLATIDSFPAAAQLLAHRPRSRGALHLEDEYDVQWLLHVLLLPTLPDLVPEDPAPKLAGASSRLDFTSRVAKLGIEVKHLRVRKAVSRMREELMVDERQYQEHPYVQTVVAFVYDPHGHVPLADRRAFERDLSSDVTVSGRTVRYVVRLR